MTQASPRALLPGLDHAPGTVVLLAVSLAVFAEQELFGDASRLHAWLVLDARRVAAGEAWRLLTYAVLHGGAVHLLFNAWFLWSLGPTIERGLGTLRHLAVFLVAALTAGVAGCLWHGAEAGLVGGSGGLFGLLGALIAQQARAGRWVTEFVHWPQGRSILNLLLANLMIAVVVPSISQAAHLGGLLGGFLVTFLVLLPGPADNRGARRALIAALTLLLVALIAYCLHPFAHAWFRPR